LSKASLWAENCPNFSFFLFGPGYFNYDYRKASLWAENCPNFLACRKNYRKGKFFQGIFFVADKPPTKSVILIMGREN
jgi:hypothetical protein